MSKKITTRLKSLLRDRSGVAALEFSLIALPFFMIMFGTIEIGLMLMESSVLEGATRDAARQIRTGSVQTSTNPLNTFNTLVCNGLFNLYDCNTIHVDVRNFSDFTAIVLPPPLFDNTGNPTNLVFQPGGAGTVETARVIHIHQFFTPLIGAIMGGTSNSIALMSTAVFKTEPYQ